MTDPNERASDPLEQKVYRLVVEAKDVTDDLIQEAIDIVEGWYDEGRIDWEDVWARMERDSDLDLGPQQDSAAMKKIQRAVRAARRES